MGSRSKAALVTGGASGIGRAVAVSLAEDGFSVLIVDVNRIEAERTVTEIVTETGGKATFVVADVSDRTAIAAAIQACRASFGGLDVMLNNAGFNKPSNFLETTEDTWRSIMEVNALGVLIGTQEAAKAMIADGIHGKIVNTASIAGRSGFADFAPYSAAKAAVINLTQSAARALARHGITVNAFAPGVVATPLWKKLDQDLYEMGASSTPTGAMESLASHILLGRVSHAEDVVGTVRFLCSSKSDYMTGQTLVIDGGMVLQ